MSFNNERRNFLKLGARSLSALGAASVVGRLSQVNALAQTACPSDYKALVCVFLFGGNDGNNTVIPISTPKGNPNNSYANYSKVRGGLALPQANLRQINALNGDVYGLHPNMPELAELYNMNKNVAVLANVGTLVNPLTKTQYQQKSAGIPLNLFSHLDQQNAWQSGLAQNFATTGWGGRVADALQGCNTANFPTIVSLGGSTLFCAGAQTNPATMTAGQTPGLQGFSTATSSQARLTAVNNLLAFDNSLTLVRAANGIANSGITQANQLNQALAAAPALSTVFPTSSLGQQLLQVAKIINVRAAIGVKRQIFFTFIGGFDTHDKELTDQGNGLLAVSQAIRAFYNATQEMGVSQSVVTFTESDFGRTLQPSGGSTVGSDHAWGSHHIVVGDAVKGDVYGQFPTQALGGPDDATSRGVWIPTTSLDQYGARLASWFGVESAQMAQVFPNLANFPAPPPAFL